MEAIELRKAAQELRAIWVVGNEYVQAAAPWTAIRTDPARAAAITRFALNLIRLYAILSRLSLPDASDHILAALGVEAAAWPDDLDRALAACRRAKPSPCPTCSSPSSRTPAPPRLPPASPAPRGQRAGPSDCAESLRLYRDMLGFTVRYQRPEEGFAFLTVGDAELMLDEIGKGRTFDGGHAPASRPFDRGLNLQIRVAALAQLLAALARERIALLVPPEERWHRLDATAAASATSSSPIGTATCWASARISANGPSPETTSGPGTCRLPSACAPPIASAAAFMFNRHQEASKGLT